MFVGHDPFISWIKNVFFHGDLVEEVYMEQPLDSVALEESNLVYRLRRSLYSLK